MNRTSVYLDITIMTLLLFIGFLIPKLLDNETFKNKKNFKKQKKKFKKNVKKNTNISKAFDSTSIEMPKPSKTFVSSSVNTVQNAISAQVNCDKEKKQVNDLQEQHKIAMYNLEQNSKNKIKVFKEELIELENDKKMLKNKIDKLQKTNTILKRSNLDHKNQIDLLKSKLGNMNSGSMPTK